ncbi:MAG: sulfatase-like hydrolase/transferase, partial [Rikenellaceae bacterium]
MNLNRRITPMCALGACALLSPSCGDVASEEKGQYNIVYIMSDDHSATAIGAYGSRLSPLNPTPNIDAFAKDAVVFDNCFCSNSISAPSRATIMTGQHSHVNGVLTLQESLKESQLYLANEMKGLGYQTAFIGKWHLGCEPSAFDFYSMFSGGNGQGTYFDPSFATSDITDKPFPKNEKFYKGHSSDIVTDIALDWFENKRKDDKPFFVMFQYKAPHDMFQFAPRYKSYLENVDIPLPETLLNRDGFGSAGSRGENNSLDSVIGTSISARHNNRPYTKLLRIKDQGSDEKNTIAAYNEYLKRYLRCVKGIDDNIERLFTYLKENDLWERQSL